MSFDTDYFSHLDTDLSPASPAAKPRGLSADDMQVANGGAATISCPKCNGRGYVVLGYANRRQFDCFGCKGTGQTTQRSLTAKAAWKKGQETKEQNLREARMAFQAEHKAELSWLGRAAEWSEYYQSLENQFIERGSLSEKQIASIRSGMAKLAAKQAERRAARTSDVDLAPIFTMFDKARESGLKKLVYRAEGLVLSPAKETSANAGAIYVKTKGGEYLGKVAGTKFIATGAATDEHKATLAIIAKNPAEAAVAYGKRTGECCCCGRELTDPASIAAGIGPICADNWGF